MEFLLLIHGPFNNQYPTCRQCKASQSSGDGAGAHETVDVVSGVRQDMTGLHPEYQWGRAVSGCCGWSSKRHAASADLLTVRLLLLLLLLGQKPALAAEAVMQ